METSFDSKLDGGQMHGKLILRFGIFLFSVLFLNVHILAQGSIFDSELFSDVNRLKFGDYLFCSENYLRAVYEYREYLSFNSNDTVQFKLAYAFEKMKRMQEAEDNFKTLFFNFNLADESKFEFYKIKFQTDSPEEFRNMLKTSAYLPDKYMINIQKLKYYSFLYEGIAPPDSSDFISVFSAKEKPVMRDFYLRVKNPEMKNPLLAAGLSAIIPGAGKIYTGQYGDGITAFLFSALLGYAAYDNYKAGHKTRSWILGTLTAFFYSGNIYGSYSSAQIFNAQIKFDLQHDLELYLNDVNFFSPVYKFLCGE